LWTNPVEVAQLLGSETEESTKLSTSYSTVKRRGLLSGGKKRNLFLYENTEMWKNKQDKTVISEEQEIQECGIFVLYSLDFTRLCFAARKELLPTYTRIRF
jgi:hypothetical protein